ncbi:hypothetical protein O181_052886 [Austropuccinia psidii MF-1]|uniref:Uncharacterized protein n=1 Tax=Austropuccinia psidii MF-1 TaxID=1389203 RepID=A0A9Q3E6H5_9BASI|nr:hypothetical protein [Austropuccinia psidii MF-1]
MPSARSGASYNPSSSTQKGYRHDYGRRQLVTEGQGLMNGSQTEKLCHYEADNTFLPSKRADTTTRSLSGHLQSHPEGIRKCISAKRVPDPFRSVGKLNKFSHDCEKISGTSHHLRVTQWTLSIYGKKKYDAFNSRMEEKQPSTTQESANNIPSSKQQQFQGEKAATSSEQGQRKSTSYKTLQVGLQNPND